jgi:hypothetical protein
MTPDRKSAETVCAKHLARNLFETVCADASAFTASCPLSGQNKEGDKWKKSKLLW